WPVERDEGLPAELVEQSLHLREGTCGGESRLLGRVDVRGDDGAEFDDGGDAGVVVGLGVGFALGVAGVTSADGDVQSAESKDGRAGHAWLQRAVRVVLDASSSTLMNVVRVVGS